jgi:hypothetical protein
MDDVNYFLGLLHREVLGDIAKVSEVYYASIFTEEVVRLESFYVYITFERKGV